MTDFDRIAGVIRYLDAHHVGQPHLDELARMARLSKAHFHRLFHRWAGVTPKDFLQCLTLEHAKSRLQASATVLDAALDAGLSGPGRLHDLLITLESATPGELRNGGVSRQVRWGLAGSPFGPCVLGWNDRGLCHLGFTANQGSGRAPEALRADWPHATLMRDDAGARHQVERIFNPEARRDAPLRAWVRATPFQLAVWRALLRIPEGCVVSYQALARSIGRPGAARAVGAACGDNPIAWLIPCHRVIRETGVAKGYRWGADRKRAMLAREFSRTPLNVELNVGR